MEHKHHKFFIGVSALIILTVSLVFGVFLSASAGFVSLEIINLALLLTSTILILMIGGLILEIKDLIEKKKK